MRSAIHVLYTIKARCLSIDVISTNASNVILGVPDAIFCQGNDCLLLSSKLWGQ